MYFGRVFQDEKNHGTLRGYTFTPYVSERADEASDENTGLMIQLNIDQAKNVTMDTSGADCTVLRWSGSSVRMELEVDYDAP